MTQNIDQAAATEDDGIVETAPVQDGMEVVEDADTMLEETGDEAEDATDVAAQDQDAAQDVTADDATEDNPETPSDAAEEEGDVADDAPSVENTEDVQSDDLNQAAS